ncbi:MAG: flagellar hook assembly protein FlgD [Pseudomonadota bacterium]
MSTVDNIGAASAPSTTRASAKEDPAAAQDRFMTLLITQMKNQDPLNPLDNAQVTSQLAQLSTVTGIDKMNATLEALIGSYQSSQSLQAAGMIGNGVFTPGDTVALAEGQALFGFELAEPVDMVEMTILDASGKAVRTMRLESQGEGTHPLAWDGKDNNGVAVANGDYRFEVTATRGEKEVAVTPLAFGVVASVSTGAQGVKLNVPGVGAVNLADIRQIL